MIEALELLVADRIDRQTIENLFDLRKTAAFHLLRRLGAERCGHSLVIPRARLMARLRELQEHPDWRWEREHRRVACLRNRYRAPWQANQLLHQMLQIPSRERAGSQTL
ncbi:MAG TPA: hypothetical protein VK638_14515 [Edaphobacter sp.]|nr:hypothetical protein [Edaphobacter sp.]